MVYRVVADGVDIFGSDTDSTLISPSLELELNSAGSLEFTLPPDHPAYDDVQLMQTEIEVYEDGDLIFFGRVSEINIDWFKQKKVTCEGALAYLNDAAIRPHTFEGALISDVFKYIIAQYNAQVAQNRQITVGNITIVDRYVYTEFDYDICLSVLTSTCVDSTGGYLFLRKDDNDVMYIDWLAEVPDTSDQPVQFASNMLDLDQDTKADDVCTVVLPLGGQVDGVNVTIASVNQGSDILENSDGIAKYGRILKIHSFGDIVDAQVLKDKAQAWLTKQQEEALTIEADAAELHYLDGSVGAYHLGQVVDVISGPHGINEEYPILKMSMDLDSGTKKVTLGTPPRKELTELSVSGGSSGSSSSGGGGGGGSSDGVRDVLVNGSSVVSDHVARVSAVTAQQLADGLALKADEDDFEALQTTVAGKANQADLNALSTAVAGKASQADLNALSTTVASKQDQLTPGAGINIDANNVISATGGGGTEVEANPSEEATDDLNTIKIGDTVYDITGGGSSTNYGKFTCDELFVNNPLPSPTSGTSDVNKTYTLNHSIDDYDAVVVEAYGIYFTYDSSNPRQKVTVLVMKNDYYENTQSTEAFRFGSPHHNQLRVLDFDFSNSTTINTTAHRTDSDNEPILYKVYGLKFENKLINRSDIYSEEERMIGRWTDGKPLYQKTVYLQNVTINKDSYTSLTLSNYFSNVENAISYDMTDDLGRINPLINANSSLKLYDIGVTVEPNSDKFTFSRGNSSNVTRSFYFTLRYTKTTDSPGSGVIPEDPQMVMMSDYYSEEEQLVGRWIDGKPLYQKTINCGSMPNNNQKTIDISSLNVENIAFSYGSYTDGTRVIILPQGNDRYIEEIANYSFVQNNTVINIASRYRDKSSYTAIITFQYTKTTDAAGTGPTKGNLIYLPALYSEEEREVGVWTDGKPIYQKTFLNIALQSGTSNIFTHNLGIDKYIDFSGRCCANGDGWSNAKPFPYYQINWGGYVDVLSWYANSITFNSKWNSSYVDITIQYTKTTDQPGSGTWTLEGQFAHHYSTSEKIVGTWIDGSTVYERTWDFSANPKTVAYNSWTSLGINIPNAKELLSSEISSGQGGIDACGIEFELRVNDNYSVYAEYNQNVNIRKIKYLTFQYTKSS